MAVSDGNNSSSSSDEDSKASAANSKAKTTHVEGTKSSIPMNSRRVTYAKLMKRKAETDEAEDRKRKKDRIRRKILAAEEWRRFVDGVPSDSDTDAYEEETTWVLPEYKIKPDRRTRELEAEAKEDSDSDDPYTHPDFINGPDSDSDEEEDSEKDSDDESDSSDESDE
ncbi:uncharacterized protein LOC113350528 [Papaver somniferum]|uniref:uncharacterized protein LOC113350528 n=1 Tax=Papaver somniferum TaxID=3469 RepID=UPI000E705CC7|nr:uncharacterized protein LOC113350528 [Papaver somniferum]